MAGNRPFIVSAALTGIAIGYSNPDITLIADDVLPRIPVPTEKFSYLEYPLEEGLTIPDTLVGRKGRVNKVEFSGTEQAAAVDTYGLGDDIPTSDIITARKQREMGLSNYNPENHASEWLTGLIKLDREVRVAAKVQDPATYASSRVTVLSGTARFSDYVNSTPIPTIKALINSTLIFRANTLVMGWMVWNIVQSHPHIVNAVRGNVTGQGSVTREEFMKLFEIKRLFVGEGWVNTARKGQPANIQRVWGNTIAALYIDKMAQAERGITFGFSAEFGSRIAGSIPDSDIGLEGGIEIRVGEKVKELVVAKDVGALLTNVV